MRPGRFSAARVGVGAEERALHLLNVQGLLVRPGAGTGALPSFISSTPVFTPLLQGILASKHLHNYFLKNPVVQELHLLLPFSDTTSP